MKATVLLLPILGLSWIFGYVSIPTVAPELTLVFQVIFIVLNSLQVKCPLHQPSLSHLILHATCAMTRLHHKHLHPSKEPTNFTQLCYLPYTNVCVHPLHSTLHPSTTWYLTLHTSFLYLTLHTSSHTCTPHIPCPSPLSYSSGCSHLCLLCTEK